MSHSIDGIDTHPESRSWLGEPAPPSEVRAKLAMPLPCILCGGPEAVRVVLVPKDQRRVKAPAGKTRAVRYSLCERCRRLPGVWRRAEGRILACCAAPAGTG
jgi:hypothetical protein